MVLLFFNKFLIQENLGKGKAMRNSEISKEKMKITRSLYEGKSSRRHREIPGCLFESSMEAMSNYKLTVSELTDEINRNGYIRRG